MIRNILGVIAQWEREVISENVKAAMYERIQQGFLTFSYALGYDVIREYRHDETGRRRIVSEQVSINPVEAEIVRNIKEIYLNVGCVRDTTKLCSERRYVGKLGRPLSDHAVYRILTRPLDSGYMCWHGIPFKTDKIPILVPIKTHNEIQRLLEQQGAKSGRQRLHPLLYLPEDAS